MVAFIFALVAFIFALAAPWVVALALETVAPGLGAVSLVFTLVGAPWLACQVAFSDWALRLGE